MLESINVMLDQFITDENNPERVLGIPKMPKKAHETDAGYDLYSPYFARIPSNGMKVIDLGVHFEIPAGFYGAIEGRSSLAIKGVTVITGTIDSGYTGSVKVILLNHNDVPYDIFVEDRIAQILFKAIETPKLIEVYELTRTARGDHGFGSTGK